MFERYWGESIGARRQQTCDSHVAGDGEGVSSGTFPLLRLCRAGVGDECGETTSTASRARCANENETLDFDRHAEETTFQRDCGLRVANWGRGRASASRSGARRTDISKSTPCRLIMCVGVRVITCRGQAIRRFAQFSSHRAHAED